MKEVKLPPRNEEAEEGVLSSILMGGWECFDEANKIIQTEDAFYSYKNKYLWRAMSELRKREQQIELVTVLDETKKHKSNDITAYYITGLLDKSVGPSLVFQYSKLVWEKYVQREVGQTAYRLYNASYESIETTRQILDDHGRYVDVLRALLPSRNGDITSIVKETVDKIKTGNNLISFNFEPLDKFAGGMTRGEITVLGGRPGHGKTTLVTNFVRKLVENGNKVLLFNREMSNVEMMRKIIVMETDGVTYDEVRQNEVSVNVLETLDEKIEKRISKKYKNFRMYDDIRSLDESLAEISKFKPDVVIDDYVQLISTNDRLERRFQLEKVMNDYKWICKKENCSSILVSQLNREIERRFDPKPKLSDFAESGVIEQTAEAALFVYYPYQYDDEKYSPYSVSIIGAKSRYGLTGETTLGFNGNKCMFYDSEAQALLNNTP